MFGGGDMNPRKMQQMMEQMGIEMDELDAEEVVIRLAGGEELVFSDADVTKMEARGQETYQVVGEPETREGGTTDELPEEGSTIPDEDVEIVAQRADVDEEAAREALEAEDGDLAAAVDRAS
ncbi:MAG: nascent polypeptide-associated complex protein [Halobacteriales archaeon]